MFRKHLSLIHNNCKHYIRNCLKLVQSKLVPSRLLPNSCLLNPCHGPKSNRTSRLLPGSKGKATKFVRIRGFSKLTRFRNTENSINPLCLDMEEFQKPQPLLVSKKVRQYTSNLYSSTPPICIAAPSWLLSLEERETQQHASHLCCSTLPICTAVLLRKYWGLKHFRYIVNKTLFGVNLVLPTRHPEKYPWVRNGPARHKVSRALRAQNRRRV